MNKNTFLWALYDFANTPLTAAIGGLYLAQWIVLDNHIDDIWYGGIFTLSTILLLIVSPFFGAWSDKIGKRMPFIKWATIVMLIFGVILGIVAPSSLPAIQKVILALILFFVLQLAYQMSLIFYDALLDKISTPKTIGKISGIGEAFGEAGWLLGPAMLLPFATGAITIFGEPGRAQVFLPAVLAIAILGLPMIFWFKEPRTEVAKDKVNFRVIYNKTIEGFKTLIKKNKNVSIFLISFMFISDAILTGSLYFAIYLDQMYHITDTQKFLFLALLGITAIPTAFIFGKMGDKLGIKKLLLTSCFNLVFVFILLSLSLPLFFVYLFGGLIGVGIGGFYATSRALLIKISPAQQLGEYFGFYATFQRFASIIGPLTWGGITLLLKDYGIMRYQIAVLSLAFLMIVGVLFLTRVKEEKVNMVNAQDNI